MVAKAKEIEGFDKETIKSEWIKKIDLMFIQYTF